MADLELNCPLPVFNYSQIVLGHGSGGRLSAELIQSVFLPMLGNPILSQLEDQAGLSLPTSDQDQLRLAFTTDSYVVQPIFFPGGDIGRLAVHGTVNDLAVGGAKPLFLSAAFILEEGLPLSDLKRIVQSMKEACQEAGVLLVTGDTKVVDKGKGDKIFITTSGIGVVPSHLQLSVRNARPGDRVIVSGTLGDHGMTIMSVRQGLEFETALESDSANLSGLTSLMLEKFPSIRCMRDPTRGGLASTLNEMALASQVGIKINESQLPVKPEVRAACEMLGFDPLFVANEGKLAAIVPAEDSEEILKLMKNHPLGRDAEMIGEVVAEHPGTVTVRSSIGGERLLMMMAGEQLPRIC